MTSIQLNLLPDTKQQSIKNQRIRSIVFAISGLAAGVSFIMFVGLLLWVTTVQKKQLNSSAASIATNSQKLKGIKGLEDALVVQNQLHTLVDLHKNKHITSRLFTFLPQITPDNLSITKLDMDYSTNVMNIAGTADSHSTINSFIDTLKLTTFKVGSKDSSHQAFKSVVESSFGLSSVNVTFALTMQFDPKLFANNLLDSDGKPQIPKLTLPSQSQAKSSSTSGPSTGDR